MTAIRRWTDIGTRELGDVRTQLVRAIDAIEWRDPVGDWPAAPGLAVKKLIAELRIPHVDLAGISSQLISSRYALYGIQGHYRNGRVRIYAVDRGGDLVPVASDHWAAEDAVPPAT